jgi:hypothetical protein
MVLLATQAVRRLASKNKAAMHLHDDVGCIFRPSTMMGTFIGFLGQKLAGHDFPCFERFWVHTDITG